MGRFSVTGLRHVNDGYILCNWSKTRKYWVGSLCVNGVRHVHAGLVGSLCVSELRHVNTGDMFCMNFECFVRLYTIDLYNYRYLRIVYF